MQKFDFKQKNNKIYSVEKFKIFKSGNSRAEARLLWN